MKFYTQNHQHVCGIDLHTKTMYLCILNESGEIVLHTNIPAQPKPFLKAIQPFLNDLVIGVECMFSWYWLADLCLQEKIARLIKGGTFPLAYVYPPELRPTRDLLRRRRMLVRMRSEVLAHIKLTHYQYNADFFQKNINKKGNRVGIAEQFSDPTVRKNIELDLSVADHLQDEITQLENYIIRKTKAFDPRTFYRLQTVPGIGQILALTILYEIGDIDRFPTVQSFASYARLVKCSKESAGKLYGYGGGKIGNPQLKWAFSEAMCLFMRESDRAKAYVAKLEKKHGKGKAMSILTHKLGRAVYFVLKRKDAFDEKYFFS